MLWATIVASGGLAAALSSLPLVPRLKGCEATPIDGSTSLDVGAWLEATTTRSLVVFGTYAADFNAIEYCQRLRHYEPKLRERGVESMVLILNASPEASRELATLVDLPESIQVWSDPTGSVGRAFGVSRGWLPDADELSVFDASIPLSPYAKLFGMLWGLGALGTLPAVIGGYLGNPLNPQPWIADAFLQNNDAARWPRTTSDDFAKVPVVGSWARRPLELATLRLQNMLGISLKHWGALKPTDLRCLTQLGGAVLAEEGGGRALFEWRDPGICAVCNFEDVLVALDGR